ncbi:hypothetical protein M899_0964 [Bacteriovorax sp. BSW11_IV]|uniref:hypothetical protein n=1 Tax=Bacteriovorax sp. BSW11_IV TaxID=1353529 RepID=UPI00038A456C|nr:hypothetical protein [Bacteriovorax sp. BSW11_IV]EQC48644.1 hypothetical protein M899_0964 [Bacteriovorax sp. BSW11_IV]
MKALYLTLITACLLTVSSLAGEGHNHEKTYKKAVEKKHDDKKDDKHDHSKHEEEDSDHSDHSDHDHGEEEHAHGSAKAVGIGKAIEAVDEKLGFKLSKEAIKALGLKLQTVDSDEFQITKATLVTSKDLKGVYRFKAGFFKLMPVKSITENKEGYKVKVEGIEFGDQLVINGIGLLRIADVYSTDKSEYGHSH